MIEVPSTEERRSWLAAAPEAEPVCLGQVQHDARSRRLLRGWVRIVAWNAQRLSDVSAAARLLAPTVADIVLLSEVDWGMARSGNRDSSADLAVRLRMGRVFAIEFVELGLGDPYERGRLPDDAVNECGLHGNAILSAAPLANPHVVRLDAGGNWFANDQPRVGGRVAVVGGVEVDGVALTVASLHLENAADAHHRAAQLSALLDELPAGPAVIGGDLNTFGAELGDLADRAHVTRMRASEPARFSWPVAHEPLFEVAASHGFEWVDANVAAPTTRHGPDGLPDHVPLKLDWLLVRGVDARRPTIIPALDEAGGALSDHDAVAVSVRLRNGEASPTARQVRRRDRSDGGHR